MTFKMAWSLLIFSMVLCPVICADYIDLQEEIQLSTFNNNKAISQDYKHCRFRDFQLYPTPLWPIVIAAECYFYANPGWFKPYQKLPNLTGTIPFNGKEYVIFYSIYNGKAFIFDHTNLTKVSIITSTFKIANYTDNWLTCIREGLACCTDFMNDENIYPSNEYPCPATWDAWSCFAPAEANSVVTKQCPDHLYSPGDTPCTLYGEKYCLANGTWNQQTNYSKCPTAPVYRNRHNYHVIVLAVSTILAFPAIGIFLGFPTLRVLRVILHRNLLIAIVLKNLFVITSKNLVILDALRNDSNDVLLENGVPCRILAFFQTMMINLVYTCMMMDGFYLHKLIVRVFSKDPKLITFYIVTFTITLIPTIIWAIVVASLQNTNCWMVDTVGYQWISDGFRIAVLSINLLLLLDIIRVLWFKLGLRNNQGGHTRSAFKATMFLIPLFGIQFLIGANRDIVDPKSCIAMDVFYYIFYLMEALQAVMVATFFCYMNNEVQNLLFGTYQKVKSKVEDSLGFSVGEKKPLPRRVTEATSVPEFK